jgi:transposase
MNLPEQLARLELDPGLADWIAATVVQAQRQAAQAGAEAAQLAEQLCRRDTELHAAQVKLQALTLELAHLRRMRFGVKSEALSSAQRDLFQGTLEADIAAAQAELDNQQTGGPATSLSRGCVPGASRCPSTCRASNIAMSPSAARAGTAGRSW